MKTKQKLKFQTKEWGFPIVYIHVGELWVGALECIKIRAKHAQTTPETFSHTENLSAHVIPNDIDASVFVYNGEFPILHILYTLLRANGCIQVSIHFGWLHPQLYIEWARVIPKVQSFARDGVDAYGCAVSMATTSVVGGCAVDVVPADGGATRWRQCWARPMVSRRCSIVTYGCLVWWNLPLRIVKEVHGRGRKGSWNSWEFVLLWWFRYRNTREWASATSLMRIYIHFQVESRFESYCIILQCLPKCVALNYWWNDFWLVKWNGKFIRRIWMELIMNFHTHNLEECWNCLHLGKYKFNTLFVELIVVWSKTI